MGIALLASYLVNKSYGETLEEYLSNKVFAEKTCVPISPNSKDVEGF